MSLATGLKGHPLEGCRAKLRRAKKHIDELAGELEAWSESEPLRLRKRVDEETGESVLTLEIDPLAPLVDWAVIVGDICHELHSTLDHLACVMIRRADPSEDCTGTGFPILDDPAWWDRGKRRPDPASGLGRLRKTDDWTRLTIKNLQPFRKTEAERRSHALWILRELSNIDKHRTLHIASTFLYSPELEFDPPGAGEITWTRPAGPVSDGDEVVRYRKRPVLTNPRVEGTAFTADLQKVIAETRIGGELVFAETAPAPGSKVMVMLDWLLDYVTWVVDLFDYQYFGGNAPADTKTIVIPATSSVTVSEAGDRDS